MKRTICALLLACLSAAAHAQTWPTKPIRIVVNQSPGGAADILARVIAQKAAEPLGQSILVENRSGGGGTIVSGRVSVVLFPSGEVTSTVSVRRPFDE